MMPRLLRAAILGWLSRSVRLGAVHALLIVVWVVLFWLASFLVTNDYRAVQRDR